LAEKLGPLLEIYLFQMKKREFITQDVAKQNPFPSELIQVVQDTFLAELH
jgi:hypothetical protein